LNASELPVVNCLRLQGLCKVYGSHRAVDNVDLTLESGQSLAIIGHNGAGKTTLMKLILGLTRVSAGRIERRSTTGNQPRAPGNCEAIGFLPESVSFPETVSGRQMLRFYARLKQVPKKECESLLDQVGLTAAAGHKINTYSKGMRQRLGLAQALLGKPDLLLLDEPTSGLDPFLRRHFYEIISERQTAGTSVIISSHALTEIEAQTDQIGIMKNGRMLVQGSLSQLRAAAALPIQILVKHRADCSATLYDSLPQEIPRERLNAGESRLMCNETQKLPLMHQLTAAEGVIDIIVRPPGLDELYAHFVNGVSL
jgi:Cu-processing system ATP-binding protein